MSGKLQFFGLFAAAAMGAFSAYMFLNTGDWVAALFFLGSLAYGVLFAYRGAFLRRPD